jgi:hypothetical protein
MYERYYNIRRKHDMKKIYGFGITIMVVFLLFGGCDVGINPLIFDGTVAAISIPIETPSGVTTYNEVSTVNLGIVLSAVDEVVDSVTFYNLTLKIDDLGSTPATTALSGTIAIQGTTLLQLNGVQLSAFSSERSIFDPSLQGVTVSQAGIDLFKNLLAQNPPPTVSIAVNGSATNSPLKFTMHTKIYTQIYTSP